MAFYFYFLYSFFLYFVYPCKPSAFLSRLQWHIHAYIYAYIKYMLIFEKDRSNPNPALTVSGVWCLVLQKVRGGGGEGAGDFLNAITRHCGPFTSPESDSSNTSAATWVTLASQPRASTAQTAQQVVLTHPAAPPPPVRSPGLSATSSGFSTLCLVWSEAAHSTLLSPWKCHHREMCGTARH